MNVELRSHKAQTQKNKFEIMQIPTIDLGDFPFQSSKLRRACEELGCFRLVNHRIQPELTEEMKGVVRSLLDLPPEIKRRNCDVIAGSGYMAPSQTNPFYEALGLYDITSHQALDDFCSQSETSPQQRMTVERYAEAIHDLIMEVGRKIAESMGFKGEMFKEWPCQFRINKYNFTPETVGSTGVQIHTDSGFLTVLQDDENVGGLEVMNKDGVFVPVDPLPGSLLINLGDLATVWSNGTLCNVKHRVQCNEASIRVSIATFLLGPKEEALEAPPEFVDADHPRLFRPISFEEYRKLRLSTKMQAGEALALLQSET